MTVEIVDVRLTPEIAKRARVWIDGREVTARCYRADAVTGTVWLYKVHRNGQIVDPIQYEFAVGKVEIRVRPE
jgi:hypothetical protein